jgi:hypothetical protein
MSDMQQHPLIHYNNWAMYNPSFGVSGISPYHQNGLQPSSYYSYEAPSFSNKSSDSPSQYNQYYSYPNYESINMSSGYSSANASFNNSPLFPKYPINYSTSPDSVVSQPSNYLAVSCLHHFHF